MNYKLSIGNKIGRWTLLIPTLGVQKFRPYWDCICECGNKGVIDEKTLISGESKSCGCLRKEMATEWGKVRRYKHGLSSHPLLNIWSGMIQRCTNPKASGYNNYGGRGVMVCDEWLYNYKHFYDWAMGNGWAKEFQLDKDTKGDGLLYSPETCCFVTRKQNNRATSRNINITFNGHTKCLTDWANEIGINYTTLHVRIFKNKWPLEIALTKPKCTKYADRVKTY